MPSPDRLGEPRSRTQKAVEAAQRVADGQRQFRSTDAQRQTYLEGLYANYSELHRQAEDLQERKQKMEGDGVQSNNREIHTLLFGHVTSHEEELGDWDTWERVESVVKKFAYGRSSGAGDTTLSENRALQARLDTLLYTTGSQRRKIATLTRNMSSVQEELQGLLNLLQMKDRAVRTLTSKNNTLGLQVRQLERECSLLRGEKKKREETEQLFSDVKYLIDVNKQLENENVELRGKLRAAASQPKPAVASVARANAEKARATRPNDSAQDSTTDDDSLAVSELPLFLSFRLDGDGAGTDDELRSLRDALEDDAKRHAYIAAQAPITGLALDVKRSHAAWMRRLEGEVDNVMCALDVDAGAPREASSRPLPLQRSDSTESLLFDISAVDGAFTGYEGYKRPSLVATSQGSVRVTVAPAVSHAFTSGGRHPHSPNTHAPAARSASPPASPPQIRSGGEVPNRETSQDGSRGVGTQGAQDVAPPHSHMPPASGIADGNSFFLTHTVVPRLTASGGTTSLPTPERQTGLCVSAPAVHANFSPPAASNIPGPHSATDGPVLAPSNGAGIRALRRTVLDVAAYSRRECLRREVLHVNQLRKRLAQLQALLATSTGTTTAGGATIAGPGAQLPRQSGAPSRGTGSAEVGDADTRRDVETECATANIAIRAVSRGSGASVETGQHALTASCDGHGTVVSDTALSSQVWATDLSPRHLTETMKAPPANVPLAGSARQQWHPADGKDPPQGHTVSVAHDISATYGGQEGSGHARSTTDPREGDASHMNLGRSAGIPSAIGELRRHLDTTRSDCEALRAELRAFFSFMGELLFEITSVVADRGVEVDTLQAAQLEALRAIDGVTSECVESAVEQRVRDALLAQHNLVLPAAKVVTDDMPDDEWLQQKLRAMALEKAMDHIRNQHGNAESSAGRSPQPQGSHAAGSLPSMSLSVSPSRDGASPSCSGFSRAHPSVDALRSGRVQQSSFYQDILCSGPGKGPLSSASFLQGCSPESWRPASKLPQWIAAAPPGERNDADSDPIRRGTTTDSSLQPPSAVSLSSGRAPVPRPDPPTGFDWAAPHESALGHGRDSGSRLTGVARNALDYFPTAADEPTGATDALQTGSAFVLQGQRIAPTRHSQAPHPQANQWYYYARGQAYAAKDAKHTQLLHRYRNQKMSRNVLELLRDMQPRRVPGAEMQPDVYRYNITTTLQRAVQNANARREEAMKKLLTPQFDEYVARFVMPLASAAARAKRVAGGAGEPKDATLVAAIRALREHERERRKQRTRLVFSRVASNIRTRHLLEQHQHVEKGSAFTTYVAILYERWREQLHAQEQQHIRAEEDDKAELMRLAGVRTEASPALLPAPIVDVRLPSILPNTTASTARGSRSRGTSRPLESSSFHFEGASFRHPKRK